MPFLQTPRQARSQTILSGVDSGGLPYGPSLGERRRKRNTFDGVFRGAVVGRLREIYRGRLTLVDSEGTYDFGDVDSQATPAIIRVADSRFYAAVSLGGGLGAAESYIRGEWDSPDLTAALGVLARNADVISKVEGGWARTVRPLRAAMNRFRANTRHGSRRNISAHYDLSNDFFLLMLDSSMTYSSGIFPDEGSSLEEASTEKYDRICRRLELKPHDHVMEIGTGWGGFAIHAAQRYGCHVTTTTISDEQHAYADRRFREEGVADRVTLHKQDYRDLRGTYDKLVSIEMIEAVGRRYLPTYFETCSRLLRPEGLMCLQAITIPDHRYANYCRFVDFIQRYIFPGGFLPSLGAIAQGVGERTDFRFLEVHDFGPHYARTLAAWRANFWAAIDAVRELGFDDRFVRTWNYYLCYCEAGFRERQIGVSQILLAKPAARRESDLSTP